MSLGYLHWQHCFHYVFSNVFANFPPKKMQSWLHLINDLYGFSPLCVFKCFFKWSTRESARVHWKMHSQIGCVCLAFPHCVFSNVPSKRWHKKKHSHIDCSCLTLLHGVFSNASSNYMPQRISNYSGCICLVFLHEKFSNVSSNPLLKMSCSHIGCICSPLCIFKCVLKEHP